MPSEVVERPGQPAAVTRRLPSPPWREQLRLVRAIFREPVPVLDEVAARYGPVCGMGAGPVRLAIVGDPEPMRELFGMSTDDFRWGHKFNVLAFVVGGESLIVADGDDWRRKRGAVTAGFSRRRLNGWVPMIVDRTDRAVDELVGRLGGRSEVVDLYQVGRSLLLEIVVRSLFGEALAARSEEIGELFRGPQAYLEGPAIKQLPHPFPGTARARVRADRLAIHAIIDERIAELRAHPEDDPNDLLAGLVSEGTLTDSEIRDQVGTLMGAGYDTTAATLAWLFWCTSLVPGLWARLRAEADEVFGPLDRAPLADEHTIARLDLAGRVMRETTRLHPAGVLAPREATTDVVVGGYRIPKGTIVLWSAHLAGRDERAWAEPLQFDPDRFVDPDPDRRALADLSWVPFGRGARNCIGFALAQMELTLIAARLAQRLDIEAVATEVPKPVGMVVNRPTGGAPMRVAARDAVSTDR